MRKTLNKTTGKAKRLIMAAALFILSVSQAWAYDFSAVSSSGHTLYYEIIRGTTNVGVVRPGLGSTYDNYVTGNVVIPATVSYNGTTYNVTELISIYNSNNPDYDYGSFVGCTGLTSVTIPNSVTTIGELAFYECSGLTSVTIPNSVTFIGDYAFYGCTGLTSVTIPNSVTTIGNYAFYNCSGLTSVNIPNSVTAIGYAAFYGCSGLNTFTIPSSVQRIEYGAFYGTAYYNNSSNWVNGVLYKDNCLLEADNSLSGSYSIQNNTRVIAVSAFYNCSGLTSITIPNSVTSIGEGAFKYCSGLTTLNFNAVNCNDFYSNYPPFDDCPISTINIGDSVQRIPIYFAYNKSSLTSVNIPNSVTSIGNYAFYNCSGLTSVNIPNSVTTIGREAFYGCSGLTSVTIGSVNTIGPQAFCNCTSIGRIDLKSVTPPTISSNSFQNVNSAIPVYIPCGSLSNYSSSSWGSRFGNLQESQVFSLGVAVNDSTMGMALILSNTCANSAIQAYAYDGYNFVGWSDGSTMNPRVVTLTQDTVFTAIFEANVQRYTITVMSANNSMGTVSGSGTYEEGTQATITATPAENHHFVSWNDGNTDNPRTITVTGDATYIASFAEDVSIDAANELDALTFHPNPTSGTITFNCTDIRKVEIMDAMGRMVATFENSNVIDLSKLGKGYYAMRITTDNGVAIRKVVRN